MEFKWEESEYLKNGTTTLSYSIFGGQVGPGKEKWRAHVSIKGGGMFGGMFGEGQSLGSGDFDTKEQGKEAVENTIKKFCKEILEAGK